MNAPYPLNKRHFANDWRMVNPSPAPKKGLTFVGTTTMSQLLPRIKLVFFYTIMLNKTTSSRKKKR